MSFLDEKDDDFLFRPQNGPFRGLEVPEEFDDEDETFVGMELGTEAIALILVALVGFFLPLSIVLWKMAL